MADLEPLLDEFFAFWWRTHPTEATAAGLHEYDGELERYENELHTALGRFAATSWKAKLVLDRHPRAAFEIARIPAVWRVIAGLLSGEVAHPSDARGLARAPLRLLARL